MTESVEIYNREQVVRYLKQDSRRDNRIKNTPAGLLLSMLLTIAFILNNFSFGVVL